MHLRGAEAGAVRRRQRALAAKRVLEYSGALVALVLCSSLFLLLALLVLLDSGRPILYRGRRYGRDGHPFAMLSFRTMVPDADRRLADFLHLNQAQGNQIKIPNDPRLTRVGVLLRRTSLDHLPNLVNVIRGEMSLVGPRPHTLQEYPLLTPELSERLQMRPGITGLWQVMARNRVSEQVRAEWDRRYIAEWSLWLDARILLRTFPVVFRCTGGIPELTESKKDGVAPCHPIRSARVRPAREDQRPAAATEPVSGKGSHG